jgi:disulfide bond formation protein DsbB
MSSQTIISILAFLTLSSNIVLGVLVLIFLFSKIHMSFVKYQKKIEHLTSSNSLKIAFAFASVATLGSLYFSEVAGFEPCKLCWLQRIFMYPLPIILGVAIYKKLKGVWNYVLPLSAVGLVIAAYHYYYQVTGSPLIPCSTVGFSVSCSERFFTYYGYITIPWMSLSAFAYILFSGLFGRKVK